MHPVEEIRGEYSNKLKGKRILLCITGSAATVESFYICRDLVRHGADVIPVMSEASTRILHPDIMEFASGNKPVLSLTGKVEHVDLCGERGVDLVLVAPCTANTISKMALGIADNAVTACVMTAKGSGIPIIIAPAMHLALFRDPSVENNINVLKKQGFIILGPRMEGNKAKLIAREEIVENVIRTLGRNDLNGKRILVIGGASAEGIDDIRVLTNRSSGRMGLELARAAFERGGDVEYWHGWIKVSIPSYIRSRSFESVDDLLKMVESENIDKFDVVIVCAALSNYVPRRFRGKISSMIKGLTIDLDIAPSVLERVRKICKNARIVAFKAEEDAEKIADLARDFLVKNDVHMVVANTLSSFGKDRSEFWIVTRKRILHKRGSKEEVANAIFDLL